MLWGWLFYIRFLYHTNYYESIFDNIFVIHCKTLNLWKSTFNQLPWASLRDCFQFVMKAGGVVFSPHRPNVNRPRQYWKTINIAVSKTPVLDPNPSIPDLRALSYHSPCLTPSRCATLQRGTVNATAENRCSFFTANRLVRHASDNQQFNTHY